MKVVLPLFLLLGVLSSSAQICSLGIESKDESVVCNILLMESQLRLRLAQQQFLDLDRHELIFVIANDPRNEIGNLPIIGESFGVESYILIFVIAPIEIDYLVHPITFGLDLQSQSLWIVEMEPDESGYYVKKVYPSKLPRRKVRRLVRIFTR